MAEAVSGLRRIQEFLISGDMKPITREKNVIISMKNATVTYNVDSKPVLSDINFELPEGKLMAVGGPVASGKSSLITTLLGETKIINGEVKLGGKIAYVPQTVRIFL